MTDDPTTTSGAARSHREHGTHVKFVIDRCRCDECREANNEYERKRRARITPPYVSAVEARRHVEFLASEGVGLKTIAKVSGVSHGTLSKLVYGDPARGMGPSRRIRPETAEKILRVSPADAADGARVDAAASWEILDALIDAGMPKSQIAERLGQRGPGLQLGRRWISARHARTITEMGREWRAGVLSFERRSRHGVEAVTLPAPEAMSPAENDGDRLVLRLVEVLEARIDQASWRQSAACRGREPWMWFPGRGDTETTDAALRICGACMVRDECRAANLSQRDGIYGGLTAKARRDLRAGAA